MAEKKNKKTQDVESTEIKKAEKKTASKTKKEARRGNNEGTIFQRSDGKWVSCVTLGYDQNGKRIRKTFYGNTRREVAIKLNAVLAERPRDNFDYIQFESLEVLMEEWFVNFKRAEVCSNTYEQARRNARVHIYPKIGKFKLSEIRINTIQSLLNNMVFQGSSLALVRKIKFLLNQFFTYAKQSRFILDNPVTECKVKNNREHKEQVVEQYKAVPIEVREKFLDAINQHELLKPLCFTLMFGGLRIGEALALKWKDVNFKENIITIDNAITVTIDYDIHGNPKGSRTVISDTKTNASVREVPMPDVLVDILKDWKELRLKYERFSKISLTKPDDLVFGNYDGSLRTYYGTRAIFKRLMKTNGLEEYHFHFHTLRHTYATLLFEAEENPKIIQMLLGHKKITTTLQIYNSVDRRFFKMATDKLEDQFKKKK